MLTEGQTCSRAESLYDVENVPLREHHNQQRVKAAPAVSLRRQGLDIVQTMTRSSSIDEFNRRMMPGTTLKLEVSIRPLEAKRKRRQDPSRKKPNAGIITVPELISARMFYFQARSGMTGTASTEAEEFGTSTGWKVGGSTPTRNVPISRIDEE